ncbi:PAS domain-containing protein [Flavisolibacter tropicus]|uniref:histidine kinase n=1 Tax=Flavisolibacter tropicus TaxID=1492898 RepID=A0A172TTF5_9BACT|nr:PAS domain-containing protein [Flavisolibacter tropicus]ANE50238.1 hypothetical protein SY85_06710 [Flavisolibacter tropicus]
MKTIDETIHSLHFRFLPSYAQYLLDQNLDAFIQIQFEVGTQLDVPLLRAFKNLGAEETREIGLKNNTEFLSYLASNKAEEFILLAIDQWISNALPIVDKHEVIPEDISMIVFMRKKAFLQLLPSYCTDPEQMIQIIAEIDYFLARLTSATTDTYIKLLQDKIAHHTHFIEKVSSTSPSAIYVFDLLEQKLVFTNDKFKDIFSVLMGESSKLDINFFDAFIHPDHVQEVKSYFKKLQNIPDKETGTYKYCIKSKEGNYRWVRSYDSVFKRTEEGKVQQIIGAIIDVNKEKTVSDELRRREEQLTEAQALAHMGSWSWNIETGEVLWSDEMYRIYQLDSNTALSYDRLMNFNHPEDRELVQLKLTETLETKNSTEFQNRIELKDGTIKYIHATAEVRVNREGQVVEMLGTVQDITERQELLNHLKRNESLYRQAEELANLGNWIWDLKNNTVEWTDQLYKIYGLEPQSEKITIDRFLSLVHPDDRPYIRESITENMKLDYVDRNFRIITPQGIIKTLRSIAQTQRNGNGQLLNIFGTEQDITEQQSLIEQLRQSESLYKQAQALARIGNWSIDLTNNEVKWSEELYNIYELDKGQELSVEKWFDYLHPEDKESVSHYWQECLAQKHPYDKVHRVILPSGKVKTLHRKGEFVFDSNGTAIKLIGTTQDITDQFLIQQELKEKQTFIQKITDATPALITSYNVATDQYEFVNEGLYKLLGYDPKEAIGQGSIFFTQLIHPDDALELIQKTMAALEDANRHPDDNQIAEYAYRIRHKNGQYRWINTYATVFDRNSNGQVERILRISLDITEHAIAREKIEEQELFIKQVADASPTILYLFDTTTNTFSYINHEVYYVLGFTPEEILEMGAEAITALYHPEDLHLLPERRQSEKKFQHTNSMMQYECRLRSKTGEWCWMVVREVVFKRNDANRPVQVLGAALDISKRKEMERSLLQNTYQLQQSNASLEEFAYVASHDLKEPLRKISTFGDRLVNTQQDRLSDDGKIYLKKIIDASQRMQTMINDLLSISMITGNHSFQPYSLQAIVEEVKQTLEYKVEKENAIIDATGLPEANIIPSQFRQLFQNLLSNSLKFTREGVQPHIQITWAYIRPEELNHIQINKANQYLKLEFSDNGIGFEDEYAGKIFQIFQRLHGRSEYEGTGIGLAICKKIVEHHGGAIYAHGHPDHGAVFTILLPA